MKGRDDPYRSFVLVMAGCLSACTGSGNGDPQLQLESAAFADGAAIPVRFSCDGAGRSPPLAWSQPPPGTLSLALVMDDPEAPGGSFAHWALFDIPPGTRRLAEAAPPREAGAAAPASVSVSAPAPLPGRQAVNGFGDIGYGGPCPPPGKPAHLYRFRLAALDVDRLPLAAQPRVDEVEQAMASRIIATATLTGEYRRRQR